MEFCLLQGTRETKWKKYSEKRSLKAADYGKIFI
jgi:hypothetical protein